MPRHTPLTERHKGTSIAVSVSYTLFALAGGKDQPIIDALLAFGRHFGARARKRTGATFSLGNEPAPDCSPA